MNFFKITTMSIGTIFINSSRVLCLPKMSHCIMHTLFISFFTSLDDLCCNGWFQTAESLVSPVRVSCPELLLLNSKVSSKAAEHSFAKRTLAWAWVKALFSKPKFFWQSCVLCCCLTQPLLLVMPWSYYPALKGLNSHGLYFPNLKSDLL